MCVQGQFDHFYEIPGEVMDHVPPNEIKRAEYFSHFAGLDWRLTGLSDAIADGASVGVGYRVPKGEIWALDYMLFGMTHDSCAWANLKPYMVNRVPTYNNNLLYPNRKDWSQLDRQTGLGVTVTADTDWTKSWHRDGSDFYWNDFAEQQYAYFRLTCNGGCTLTSIRVMLLYWRTRLYDKLLKDLRSGKLSDCEIQRLMEAGACTPFKNLRNDKGW